MKRRLRLAQQAGRENYRQKTSLARAFMYLFEKKARYQDVPADDDEQPSEEDE